MLCDLERIYGELATKLPQSSEQDDPFLLDESTIPPAPAELCTDRVIGYPGHLQYLPGCRGDSVAVITERRVFRQIGLLTLAVLFHEQCDRAVLHLTRPESRLKHIVLTYQHSRKSDKGFRIRPWVLGYAPDEGGPRTFSTDELGFSAPLFRLTNLSGSPNNEREWQSRDTLEGIGGTEATGAIAQFLLDAGLDKSHGHFSIPANHTFFAAEVVLWTPDRWQNLQQKLAEWNRAPSSGQST